MDLPSYEVLGPKDAPAVVALGGISANRHICSSDADSSHGWWESVAGAGRALDTQRYRLIGSEFLDAGQDDDGRPKGIVTMRDQADALAAVLDHIGVLRVHALIGASYGGMVSLAFAERYPERVERLVVIGAAHRTHPMTIALKVIQRRIVELGLDTGRAHDAMVLARALAITTFRSEREFGKRFASHRDALAGHPDPERSEGEGSAVRFPVESYLLKHGERFAQRFSPARFLALSLSGDLQDVDPSRITAHTTLVAPEGDRNVPREIVEELAQRLGGPGEIVDLPSEIGHDAFLTEAEAMSRILRKALEAAV